MPRIGIVNIKAFPIINRLILPALFFSVAAAAWAQDSAVPGGGPLDLTVPTAALTKTWGAPANEDAARLPGLGEQSSRPSGSDGPGRGGALRSDLPYGTGYEARHNQGGGGHGRGRGR